MQLDILIDSEEFLQSYKNTNKIKERWWLISYGGANFDYKINEQGGFDCTTTIVSIGYDLFKSNIDENKIVRLQIQTSTKKLEEEYKINFILKGLWKILIQY